MQDEQKEQEEKDEEEESDNVRSTKRPIGATTSNLTKRQKREKEEDCLLQKVVQCMEADTSNNSTNANKIFGDYIASELRAIEDQKAKRFLKHQIQSLIFSANND